MTRLITAATLALLMTVPALAQTTAPSGTTQGAPQATTPGAMTPGTSTTTPPRTPQAATVPGSATTQSGVQAGSASFYTERGEWRASKLMGVKVTNAANETIGDVNELLIDKSGKIAAVVIGVGGFLGMGERHAAVSFDALQMTRDTNNNAMIKVNLTKEQLNSAPEWTWKSASVN